MTTSNLFYALAALAAVVLLVLLSGRVARMTSLVKRAGGKRLCVAESLAIDARRRLLLVRCDGREVLLLTGTQDLVVGWLHDPAPAEAGPVR